MTKPSFSAGTVYLVGAGPGDPGLLTIAGKNSLEIADIVVYDRLVDTSILNYAPTAAERIYVGKSADRHSMRQEEINALLAESAQAGKTVVRLKGGDPFVFGRGGEEAEYLRERNIPFVIVPGITSAIAAPAYAGIPVTHRDAASSFAVITGHERGDRPESTTRAAGDAEQRRDWSKIVWAADTLVFLMGVESLGEITGKLIAHGRLPETPVAVIQWGTWTTQRTVVGTLATIAEIVLRESITAPAVTVVGDVVKWREKLQWWDNRPLFGKRIVVTRAREQASELTALLRLLGAEPIEIPTIAIEQPDNSTQPDAPYAEIDHALSHFAYHWTVFTSANAVTATFARMTAKGLDARLLAHTGDMLSGGRGKVAAIGKATADALRAHGIIPDFVPQTATSEGLAAEFPETQMRHLRIFLPRAQEANDLLPDTWRKNGATVDDIAVYKTAVVAAEINKLYDDLHNGTIDAVTFTSSSTVKNFKEAIANAKIPDGAFDNVVLACIGPVTAQSCSELFRPADVIAEEQTINGLVDALSSYFVQQEGMKNGSI